MLDFDFHIAARNGGIYYRNNPVKMESDVWPLLIAKNDDGNPAGGKILLVANVLVGRQQQFIARFLSLTQQLAVLEFVPADLPGKRYFVSGKTPNDGLGVPLSKRILIRTPGPFPSSAWRSEARL